MNSAADSNFNDLPEPQMLLVNRLCNQFESLWRSGTRASIEEVLADVAAADRLPALHELVPLELEYRRRVGTPLSLADYSNRFPQLDRDWLAGEIRAAQSLDPDGTALMQTVPEKLGDYRIVCELGGGGMGTVYKAVHERMGRSVALKVLRAEIQRDPLLLRRFDREVRVAANLSHPNIVAALDAREENGIHFLITEYVDGADLQQIVREGGPLSVAEAVNCIAQAARGLDYAHERGIVHRDIKPANLLRDASGVVKLLDMGLARWDVAECTTSTELTHSGMLMGTAAYMAPEQARDTRRADARSDIYSLGCTLYYLLHGRSPFAGETPIDAILSHLRQPIPSLAVGRADVPPSLDELFRRMVAKEPPDRIQSARELIAALETIGGELQTSPLPALRRPNRPDDPAATLAMNDATTRRMAAGATQAEREPTLSRRKLATPWLVGAGCAALAVIAIVAFRNDGTNNGNTRTADKSSKAVPSPPDGASNALSQGHGVELVFNGRSSYVAAPEIEPQSGGGYTLEAIAAPSRVRLSNVISWFGPDWMALYLGRDGNWGLARLFGETSHLIQTRQVAEPGKFVHVAGVYRGAELSLYIDGQAVATEPGEFGLTETSGGLFIGGFPAGHVPPAQSDRFFDGSIVAVRISRGGRYTSSFTPPTQFEADKETIALFVFDVGSGREVTGSGERKWTATIVDAEWRATPDASR